MRKAWPSDWASKYIFKHPTSGPTQSQRYLDFTLRVVVKHLRKQKDNGKVVSDLFTVLPAKSNSDFMFCLQSYQGLIINRSLVN